MTDDDTTIGETRRHLFGRCAVGLGKIALASLATESRLWAAPPLPDPLAPKAPHFAPKAKSVIYLFMAGGPSQLDLFDYKPRLHDLSGKPVPDSFIKGKRFAFMDSFSKETPKLLGSHRSFKRYGQTGTYVSEQFPHLAGVVDDLAFLYATTTDVFNHAPAKLFCNTGSAQSGRPSMGSWVTYGIGSEARDLPGFVVLQSGPRGPRGGAPLWGSGFLPTSFQGVPFRNVGEPILDLASPHGISASRQRQAVNAVSDLNRVRLEQTGDPEIATRIAAYEMAYRMQSSAPELTDLNRESAHTRTAYGVEPGKPSFARNCLLARRLVERGTRFIQLYHTDWDHHGGAGQDLEGGLDRACRDVDQAMAALIKDLKERGLLDSTLVVWGGEFGRTPMGEIRETTGRNHHIDSGTMWMAGGGVKAGVRHGSTDELGFGAVEGKVHMHDVQATILALLGLDHKRLTFRFQGRDFRLTDVRGEVIRAVVA